MGITVEKFLDIVGDYKLKTVAGEDGLGNITEWFHFVEDVYELKHVNEKELIFSSGRQLQEEAAFRQFIEQLIFIHCSGLVVPVGRHLQEIPCSIVQFCDEKEFPLIKAPQGINISNVIKLFCLQILESEKANKQLFSAMKNAISFPQKTERAEKKISKTQTVPTRHGAGPQGRFLFALIPFDRLEKRSDALT